MSAARWLGAAAAVLVPLGACGVDSAGEATGDGGDAGEEADVGSDAGVDGATSIDDGSADADLGPPLYLFVAEPTGDALGGRAGADALCAATQDAGAVAFDETRAFLSVTEDDEIRDMPALYGVPTDRRVVSLTGATIAADWRDLLDGAIVTSLREGGVHPGDFWYSGSEADGSLAVDPDGGAALTCSEWTADGTLFDGAYGVTTATDGGWMAKGRATCALDFYRVLCLGWSP